MDKYCVFFRNVLNALFSKIETKLDAKSIEFFFIDNIPIYIYIYI